LPHSVSSTIHHVYLGLGSNIGDRWTELVRAVERLSSAVHIEALSSVYDSAPLHVTDQPRFLNMVVSGSTLLLPEQLLQFAKDVEQAAGRVIVQRFGPRTLDVDILLFDDLISHKPELILPHPRLAERAFVLQPLAEIAPELVDPLSGAHIKEMLRVLEPADIRQIGPLFTGRH